MNVDANDNAYFADPSGAVIIKVSPDGKMLGEIGTRGKRGDWDEAKGQRLLWEPVSIAFDPRNGDMYIGEGHGAESPNDRQSGEPHNTSGAARVIRLDKDGKFIHQIYGNMMGAGHFWQAHDSRSTRRMATCGSATVKSTGSSSTRTPASTRRRSRCATWSATSPSTPRPAIRGSAPAWTASSFV